MYAIDENSIGNDELVVISLNTRTSTGMYLWRGT